MVDRNGDDVLRYYEAAKAQFNLTSGDPALKLSYTVPFRSFFWHTNKNNNNAFDSLDTAGRIYELKTVAKSYGLSISGKLTSTDDYLFLNDLSSLKPAFEFKIGFQNTIDLIHDLSAIPSIAKAYGFELIAKMDNTQLYDSIRETVRDYQPWTFGVSGHFTLVKYRWMLPSASLSLLHTWNKSDLLKYQDNKPSYVDPNAIALEDFVGFIGNSKDIWNTRIRISCPLFLPSESKFVSRLSAAPYFVANISTETTNLCGFTLNYFSSSITGSNYNYSEAFGIGFDWENKPGSPVNNRIFVFGTLNIGDLIKHEARALK